MDYEKKYKEALEKARELYNLYNERGISCSNFDLKTLFPELRESENERIRKALLEYFGEQCDMSDWNGIYGYEVYAWLEKQGEQKPVIIPKFRVGDIIRWKKVSSIEYTIKEICDKGYINTDDGIMDISQTDIEFELVEQKPEWSEEDEKMLQNAIFFVEFYRTEKADTAQAEVTINWLKSLTPQSHWKPSDEQIEALEHFVRSIGESGYASPYDNNTKLLYSLLEQLKKLKE